MSDLEVWPRIKQAIYATALSRSAVEWQFPECHKKNCAGDHGDPEFVLKLFQDAIAESVWVELLCSAVSDPDLGELDEQQAVAIEQGI